MNELKTPVFSLALYILKSSEKALNKKGCTSAAF
jgi:flagellar biosynthesis regulator FlaF